MEPKCPIPYWGELPEARPEGTALAGEVSVEDDTSSESVESGMLAGDAPESIDDSVSIRPTSLLEEFELILVGGQCIPRFRDSGVIPIDVDGSADFQDREGIGGAVRGGDASFPKH